jgi:uracil-DNA glycosylase
MDIDSHNRQIINCIKCPRLAVYIREVAAVKVKRHRHEEYWGKPIPGFGDPDPEVLIVGLAPAAHGGNRTGRIFTGDSSGDWLFKALYEAGFANQPHSVHANDGMQLQKVFITATVRCAPPDNKPLPEEIKNCSSYLERELIMFTRVKVIVCLGQIAFYQFLKNQKIKKLKFGHLLEYPWNDKVIISSYHPSRQNTQTGKLLWDDWLKVFLRVHELLT